MPYFIIPGVTIFGLLVGQLVNYLADVLPVKRKIAAPTCKYCQTDIRVKSYLIMRRCDNCRKPPSLRRWILLVVFPFIFIYLWYSPHDRLGFWLSVLLISYLVLVGVIDIEHKLILFVTSIAGAIIGIIIGIILHGTIPTLLGFVSGFATMYLLYLLGAGFMILVSKIRKQPVDEIALGFGDVSLSAVLGAILGLPGIFLGLFFTVLLGGIFSGFYLLITFLLKKYKPLAAIPYAPFLIISTLILLFR